MDVEHRKHGRNLLAAKQALSQQRQTNHSNNSSQTIHCYYLLHAVTRFVGLGIHSLCSNENDYSGTVCAELYAREEKPK